MNRELSPLERSRQILQALAEEELKRRVAENPGAENITPDPQPAIDLAETEGAIRKPVKKQPPAASAGEVQQANPFLRLDPQGIVQGFIFSEILGKPLARRRGRW